MTTSFGGQFEDDPKGFVAGDKVRIVRGEHAGKFGTVDQELLSGYYVVTPEGDSTRPAVLETFELEPIIEPRVVGGFPVPAEGPVTVQGLSEEVEKVIPAVQARIAELGVVDGPLEDCLDQLLADLGDVIASAVETHIRVRQYLAKVMLSRGPKVPPVSAP